MNVKIIRGGTRVGNVRIGQAWVVAASMFNQENRIKVGNDNHYYRGGLNMFKDGQIIKRFRYKEFAEIPTGRLMDFVKGIPVNETDKEISKQQKQVGREISRLKKEMSKLSASKSEHEKILETWENHFQSQNIPYVITVQNGTKTLWKERRV